MSRKSNLRQHMFSKPSGFSLLTILVLLLVIVWIGVDIVKRFHIASTDDRKLQNQEELTSITSLQMTSEQAAQLDTLYAVFTQPDNDNGGTNEITGLSAEEQAKQKGNLTRVYSGNNILELKAVIAQKMQETAARNAYALLNVTDITTNTTSIETVMDGQQLFGYRFDIVNNTRVKLTRMSGRESEINNVENTDADIWLIMYQQQTDNSKR